MANIQRYFIELAYDGTNYHGWQVQPNAVTVQEVLDKALTTLLRQSIETVGCGRTDTGVHAKDFFAHLDVQSMVHEPSTIDKRSLNALLPHDIAIKSIIPVNPEAHARFDATLRSYEYHIHFEKNPFLNNYSWLIRDKPNLELMNRAAAIVMEYTDFSCFSKSNTQVKTNNCKIAKAEWVETENGIVFHVSADRFLRNMVRAIVGTLLQVGKSEMQPEDIRKVIESKNRSKAGTSVPACGLYLTEIKYPYL
ncbi:MULTISPECIES: tRNA pseudouridine(38-40) synthase TruA [unclassified Mucilaginibacter]|uniref:tRNA pseudouridine(38-40) synthase TruA n=1 Tax=unclassified Mucilaginibacter TaxID=2617802 RepID=UPI002AC979E9|nr:MULTISPECIES: tRNA pseudouridine(38-40) synthase TruA [unclassified Mucilaginibacter]MEB0248737.1 tRNA pseudouridine(38-40) synthase TruA [Mucilaginibacter sp. 5B2]MEB0261196.1 tRNA pseudouridine(38-40) synthase TruA [Mucilaginibacter sp. 10I4]MEB0280369.1 tRNA pseudouridine(38-40) synthase TruA [Mucilaginibacter sp. 10B2]MEB0300390.1 tRNA pseudouridine(38-40) synthase TruA [Mucilaginibacter sp. 5C4]WPX24540.1 tRNA pseudouridine(38-40) synthase TruA [Mucilaginibacter sp. 5C4]